MLDAVAARLGYEVHLLRKGGDEDSEEIDDPALFRLVELARRDWMRWGDQLIRELVRLHEQGRLFPLGQANERLLIELFRDHELALVLRFSGLGRQLAPRGDYTHLVERGLVSPSVTQRSWIELSYRLGRGADVLGEIEEPPTTPEDVAEIVRRAAAVRLTDAEQASLLHAQRRGAAYMRRPAAVATGNAWLLLSEDDRLLSQDDVLAVRGAVTAAVERRASVDTLERDLRAAVQGTPLLNDMRRVARTELVRAHCWGAYATLKQEAARLGVHDPRVFKVCRTGACTTCVAIWGPSSDPRPHLLSEIEAWEAGGGNFRKPRSAWQACIGPIHPNCTEGPLLLYRERAVRGAQALAARIAAARGIR